MTTFPQYKGIFCRPANTCVEEMDASQGLDNPNTCKDLNELPAAG
jgi:hypothetical protein